MTTMRPPDELMRNMQQRAELVASRQRLVCRATFGDAYTASGATAFKYTPEKCARKVTRPHVTRRPRDPGSDPSAGVRQDARLMDFVLRDTFTNHVPRALWSMSLDKPDAVRGHAAVDRFVQLAAGSRCITQSFQKMISAAMRKSHPDPVERAHFLVASWNRRLLSRPSVSAKLRTSIAVEIMMMARAHCDAVLRMSMRPH